MGCSSSQSLQLAENIVRDHFYLNTSNQNVLKTLATDAPQFVSNFITAVTELYLHDIQKPKKMPPKNLLEVITSWVWNFLDTYHFQLRFIKHKPNIVYLNYFRFIQIPLSVCRHNSIRLPCLSAPFQWLPLLLWLD